MLSLAKNERGIRLASAAIILLPLVTLVCAHSRSTVLDAIVLFGYFAFTAGAFIAFLLERAEEEEDNPRR